MDAADFQDAVEESMSVELDRLGSSKLLVALTDADLTEERVLRVAADSERAAVETLEAWIDDETRDDARELFADHREQERDHYDRVAAMLEADHEFDSDAVGPMHDHLRSLESTTARLGGLVGRALVADRTHLQLVSFFVNEGDERLADRFRDLRSETRDQGDEAAELLAALEPEPDWDRARTAATTVIEIAYDAYADSLNEMGLDPKPIC